MNKLFFKSLLVLSCLLLISSSVFSQDMDLKKQIEETNKEMLKAVMDEDMEAALSFYTDDAISLPSYEPMIKGKAAIKEHNMKSHEAGFKMNSMTLNTLEVLSAGDLAYEIGTYKVNMTIPGMPNTVDDNGKYLTVWQKQDDGSWKMKVEIWNSDNNPWMGMGDMQMEHESD
jgi:uncharacterized protein (TIGR02246 family)